MSKRVKHYTVCDVCGKDDLFDEVEFCNSDWYLEFGFDVCDSCTENGEARYYIDIEESEDMIDVPERGYKVEWGFVKYNHETEKDEFIRWLPRVKK